MGKTGRRFHPRGARIGAVLSLAISVCVSCGNSSPERGDLILATTTSLQDSGLLDVLVPMFEASTPWRVKTIAVGTGQALAMAARGEADVLLAHAPEAERRVLETGAVHNRRLVMYNDFVIVGPAEDPAGLRAGRDAAVALRAIAAAEALFVSRGDDSGTHKRERALWRRAGLEPSGSWYQEAGLGMGAALQLASEKSAYTLSDRATYLALGDAVRLDVLVEGDAALLNVYHVMQVNADRFARANGPAGVAWVEFMLSDAAQQAIAAYGVERFRRPLFQAAGGRTEEDLAGP